MSGGADPAAFDRIQNFFAMAAHWAFTSSLFSA